MEDRDQAPDTGQHPEARASAPEYYLQVDAHPRGGGYRSLYKGSSAADAMAAWSKAISEGEDYVMLEALREIGAP